LPIRDHAANVLVYDRATGQLIDEKMPTPIRLAIRAIYRSKLGKGTLLRSIHGKGYGPCMWCVCMHES
jgi:hypothetical protein